MNSPRIDLKQGYGTGKAVQEVRFSESRAHLVYTPNGLIKSSLAQSAEHLVERNASSHRILENPNDSHNMTAKIAPLHAGGVFLLLQLKASTVESESIAYPASVTSKANVAVEKKLTTSLNGYS